MRRGGPDETRRQEVEVPSRPNQTILDAVTWIQRERLPDLAYRFACRVGMCGSCAMMVNGLPRWTCRTLVSDIVRDGRVLLDPLANLPVIRDLVADMTPFFEKWQRAGGRHVAASEGAGELARIPPGSPERREASAGIECINCAVCYAGCEVVAQDPGYLGPAALNRAWTLVNDSRDRGDAERLRAVAAAGGCHACHTHQRCAHLCPNNLSPTRSISGLKRRVARAVLTGEL